MNFKGSPVAIGIAMTLFCTPSARANVVFDWTGSCDSGCAGTATAVLTLIDAYSFGTPISSANFVSLAYKSNDMTADLTPTSLFEGGLNADGSFASPTFIIRDVSGFPQFNAGDTGGWEVASATGADSGTDGHFTPVVGGAIPEPSSWAMMLLGFAGLGYASYRASRRAADPLDHSPA
jgi:hypothetical protein